MKKSMVFGFLLIALFTFPGCSVMFGLDENAPAASITGNITNRSFSIEETFLSVQVSGGAKVTLIQSDETSLSVSTDEGYFPRVRQTLANAVLHLGTVYAEDSVNADVSFELRTDLSKLTSLSASGGSSLKASHLIGETLQVDASGGGQVNLDSLTANTVKITVSGGGNISLASLTAARAAIHGSGGGSLSISERCTVNSSRLELSGGAKIEGICVF